LNRQGWKKYEEVEDQVFGVASKAMTAHMFCHKKKTITLLHDASCSVGSDFQMIFG